MSKIILSAVTAAILSLAALPAAAQDAGRMDQVVRAAADAGEFSGSVLVARDGEVLFDRGYGLANREWNVPNAGDTRFRLASVTKQFTAVAVVLLAERGQIDLDAPVKTYLPDAPAAWDAVTVRHLLNHTSGVPNFTSFPDYAASKTLPTTPAALIERFKDKPLDFQPGERWAYSNSGYVLLTAIIETVSGQSYADFVKANLFEPLGMTDSGYDDHATVLARRASGYSRGPGGIVNADYVDMSVPQGAGGLYSTTRDLLKWEQGLFGGRLLNAQSMAQLTTPGLNNYALGLRVTETGGDTIVSHNGGIEGFNTYLGYETGDKLTVVVLGNLNGGAPDKLGVDLMTLARGGTVTLHGERQAIAVAPEALTAYEGVYEASPTFAITMTVVDGKLMTQATGQEQFELFAEGPDRFFLKVVDAQVVFTRDAAGAVDGMVLHQGGRQMRIRKK